MWRVSQKSFTEIITLNLQANSAYHFFNNKQSAETEDDNW